MLLFFCFFVFSTTVSVYSKPLSLHTTRRRAAGTCGEELTPHLALTCTAGGAGSYSKGATLAGFKERGAGGYHGECSRIHVA